MSILKQSKALTLPFLLAFEEANSNVQTNTTVWLANWHFYFFAFTHFLRCQPSFQKHVPLLILTQLASSGNNNLKWNYTCRSFMCIFQYFNINMVSIIWCNETNSQLWLADGMFVFRMLRRFDFCKQQQQMMWWTEPAWYFQLRLRGLMSISVCWQA